MPNPRSIWRTRGKHETMQNKATRRWLEAVAAAQDKNQPPPQDERFELAELNREGEHEVRRADGDEWITYTMGAVKWSAVIMYQSAVLIVWLMGKLWLVGALFELIDWAAGITNQRMEDSMRKACAMVVKIGVVMYILGCGMLIATWCVYQAR